MDTMRLFSRCPKKTIERKKERKRKEVKRAEEEE